MNTVLSRNAVGVLALLVVGAVAAIVLLPGLADDVARPDRDGVVEVVMDEYRFEPATVAVPAGEPVTLRFVNDHEFANHISFGHRVVEENRRAVAFAEDLFEGLAPRVVPVGAVVTPEPPYQGFTVLVQGGQTVTIEVVLPEDRVGTWQIGCFTGRGCHYRAGMAAELIVE